MLERGNKIFSYFLHVHKDFDTVQVMGLSYELFSEMDIKRRMWLAIEDLYTDAIACVLYSGSFSRVLDISKGWAARIFAPFT